MGTPEAIEAQELNYDHAELGGLLAERWGLPRRSLPVRSRSTIRIEGGGESLAGVSLWPIAGASKRASCRATRFPGPEGRSPRRPRAMARITAQVDALMELIESSSPGVRVAA